MRDQMDEGDLAGVTRARKHAFAKEGCPEANPIEPTDQAILVPRFNAIGVTPAV